MTTPLKAVAAGGNSAELREWVVGDFLPVALGGTGGTTAAAARSNLGLGAAAVAAILGAVSQSGGVPTGAIFQTGSNANGEFIQFGSGWQICTKTLALSTGATTAVGGIFASTATSAGAFPASFSQTPIVISNGTDTRGGGWAAMDIYPTATTWGSFSTRHGTSGGVSGTVYLVAVGKWF
jgi:hypothetical protein